MNKRIVNKKEDIRLFLTRHAQPVSYGFINSRLSKNGTAQTALTAKIIYNSLSKNQEHVLKVVYSSRKRSRESAITIDYELRKIGMADKMKKVTILKPGSRKIFQTADLISSILQLGYPLEDALRVWAKLPDETLKENDIQTPDEIISSFFKFLNAKEIQKITDLIAVTHETTLMAFQSKFFPELDTTPEYNEIMIFNIHKNDVYLNYRNKEVKINA